MKYGVLRFVGMLLQIVGWFIAVAVGFGSCVFAALAAAGVASAAETTVGIFSGVAGVVIILVGGLTYAVLVGVPLIAMGQLVFVLLDIEKNTRETVEILRPREEEQPPMVP